MELSTIYLLKGVGIAIAIVGVSVYIIAKQGNPKNVFIKNKHLLYPLVKKLPASISVKEWTGVVVSINSQKLTKWWTNLVKSNGNNSAMLTASLIAQLKQWDVDSLWNITFEPEPAPKPKPERPYNLILAKKALLNNLPKISILLPTLHNGFSIQKWTEVIVDINDYDLTEFWKKMAAQPDVTKKMLQVLSSWQIKCDTCKSFTCSTKDNLLAYKLPDGEQLVMGQKYKVESPCWVLTVENSEGVVSKEILVKGVVVPKVES